MDERYQRLNTLDTIRTLANRAAEPVASIGNTVANGLTIDECYDLSRQRMQVVNSIRKLLHTVELLDQLQV